MKMASVRKHTSISTLRALSFMAKTGTTTMATLDASVIRIRFFIIHFSIDRCTTTIIAPGMIKQPVCSRRSATIPDQANGMNFQ